MMITEPPIPTLIATIPTKSPTKKSGTREGFCAPFGSGFLKNSLITLKV